MQLEYDAIANVVPSAAHREPPFQGDDTVAAIRAKLARLRLPSHKFCAIIAE
jgi:hypothetical protein